MQGLLFVKKHGKTGAMKNKAKTPTKPRPAAKTQAFPHLQPAEAVEAMKQSFPFAGYFAGIGLGSHLHVAEILEGLLPQGGKVLDVGSGPLDKTVVLAAMGFECTATDDFEDPWHKEGDSLKKIMAYGKTYGIEVIKTDGTPGLPVAKNSQDAVIICDVLEHLPCSPKELLENAMAVLKPGGYLLVTVPNAVNLRKRLDVLRGRTNYPPYAQYYHCGGVWRGHIREYARNDLEQMEAYLGSARVLLESAHHMLEVLPVWAREPFKKVTQVFPGWRDSWVYVGQKPHGWQPKR